MSRFFTIVPHKNLEGEEHKNWLNSLIDFLYNFWFKNLVLLLVSLCRLKNILRLRRVYLLRTGTSLYRNRNRNIWKLDYAASKYDFTLTFCCQFHIIFKMTHFDWPIRYHGEIKNQRNLEIFKKDHVKFIRGFHWHLTISSRFFRKRGVIVKYFEAA